MNGSTETKSEIRARIDELSKIREALESSLTSSTLEQDVKHRINELYKELDTAEEDISTSIIDSHRALCKVKNMGEKEAYGHDPALYYALGVCGEAGEMANAIVKAMRYGPNARERYVPAIIGELPDVIIYAHVLAYTHDINLNQLVGQKANIVIQRAIDGYYGGKLHE
jgi:NTP pyrophosphatase (non-canonical NTP hydrolase)